MKINFSRPYIYIHTALWALFFLWLFTPGTPGGDAIGLKFLSNSENQIFFLYGTLLNMAAFYTYVHLALPNYVRANRFRYFVLVNLAYLVVFVLVETLIDFAYVNFVMTYYHQGNPPSPEAYSLEKLFNANLALTAIVLFVANLYGFAYTWFKDQNERRVLEQEVLKAELSALKHQINPHFLFNILNGLYGLAFKNEDEDTAEGIAKLSQLMRYMLYEANEPKVPLSKEIAYIENYIDLQKLRTNGSTHIDFQVSGAIQQQLIAPMLFIPFIENAFKHGISTVRPSSIDIEVALEGDQLEFKIENPIHRNGQAKPDEYGGIGLKNVQKRLELIYPQRYDLDISDFDQKYRVQLSLTL
ncbi:MAG: histidine kinase [Bacteroidota bacterium]